MMDSMLDEYMQDVLGESDMYKEESFEAFESDADSMLLLGQPIDDQIRTMNISSILFPKKSKTNHHTDSTQDEVEYEGFDSEDGEEIEEDEYEDSFESPGKSPNKQDLKELSSLTLGPSKIETNDVQGTQTLDAQSPQKEKKKRTKKKKTLSAASIVKSGSSANKPDSSIVGGGTSSHAKKESPRGQSTGPEANTTSGSRSNIRTTVPRMNSAGAVAAVTRTVGERKSQVNAPTGSTPTISSSSQHIQHQNLQQYMYEDAPPSLAMFSSNPGPGSVVSHQPSQSVAGRHAAHSGAAFSGAILQKQLDTALKQVAMYRRENEALQQHLDSAGINEAVERYKALLISKELTIHQLESENNGLKSIARYQGKYLNEQAHQPSGFERIQSHDKQIEIMLIHTRKMKEKVKRMEAHEKELLAENEHLHTQNGRIQRKNAKLKKILKAEDSVIADNYVESPEAPPQHQHLHHVISVLTHANRTLSTSPDESEKVDAQAVTNAGNSMLSVGVIDPHGSLTSQESFGPDHSLPQMVHKPHFHTSLLPSPTSNAAKKVLEEKDAQLRKQAATIDTLEKSLQNQRGRFMREIDSLKAQLEESSAQHKRLEVELDKKERFGRSQVRTLNEICSSYEELSAGYKKLLQASELFDRDSAPPEQLSRGAPSPSEQTAAPRGPHGSDEAGCNYVSPHRPQSSRSSSSRGASRSAAKLTALSSEK